MSEQSTQAATAAFNLEDFELADTCVFTLRNKRGDDDLLGTDGKPVTAEIWGPGSEIGQQALHTAGRAAQMRLVRTMKGDMAKDDAEKAEREQAQKLTKITKRLSDNFPVSPANLHGNPKLRYISVQFEEQFSKFGNF